eukprot:12829080-Alexandrium_andersonii.AAC.1
MRGPSNGLDISHLRSGGVRSAHVFVQIQNPPTKAMIAGSEAATSRTPCSLRSGLPLSFFGTSKGWPAH